MDPLTVIASVAGIATAAGEVIKIIGPYTTATSDAHKIAAEVSSEALAYASLIQVDQLTAVLFDGVKIFSELLAVLQTLPPPEPTSPGGSLWTPIQWVRKKGSLTAILHRLRAFKSSIVCILSILQSDSQARAEESQQQLIAAVDILLRGNNDLSSHNTVHERYRCPGAEEYVISAVLSLFEFDFEHDLKLSRVYRLAKRDTMDFSIHSSVARTHAWSSLSGISLSDISHISVLALPLYVEDISNPQHYNFGQDTIQPTPLLAPTLLTRSIYHDCIEVQVQLSQLEWFAQFQQQESSKDENPLSNLINLVRLFLARLTKAEPNPAGLAVEAFLCDERLYVNRLESFFENAKIRSFRMLSSDTFDPLFAPIGPLLNVQRKFLIKAEMLVSKSYLWQTWQLAFQEWAIYSRAYYASLITGEAESKSMVRAAFPSDDLHDVERRGLLSDVLATLGLPSLRLDKYDTFLEELTQYGLHDPKHIESAKRSLKMVKEAVNNSNIAREMTRAKTALSKDQDFETKKVIWGLGKLLMFDKVDIMDARQHKIQLFLFQNGIVKAIELFPKGRRRGMLGYGKPSPLERLRPRLSITQIIPAKNLKQVQQVPSSSEQEINMCEIKWMNSEKECRTCFPLGSQTRSLEWINKATRVKRENQLYIPYDNFLRNYEQSEYNLVLLVVGGCRTSDLTIQLLKFVNPDLCDQFDPSKKDTYRKSCIIDNEDACIDVIDTTGQEEYSAMIQQYMRQGEGFMLVYSVTSRQSFEEIATYHYHILKQKDKDHFPMVIVGIDRFRESLREVTRKEGECLANELGCTFLEVDAKFSVKVEEAFFDLVREVRLYRRDGSGY
ncbi:Ras family, other [Fusarium agapanthi]|uniref:Ras family, other n=1 Tax=Fusarium agapanthi TaxID=1803897 RepID=A0A9P5E800_9HYPO|nr:Ras family, other [Fusarium agapanthi]